MSICTVIQLQRVLFGIVHTKPFSPYVVANCLELFCNALCVMFFFLLPSLLQQHECKWATRGRMFVKPLPGHKERCNNSKVRGKHCRLVQSLCTVLNHLVKNLFFSSEPLHKRGCTKPLLHAPDFFFLSSFLRLALAQASSVEICNLIFFVHADVSSTLLFN